MERPTGREPIVLGKETPSLRINDVEVEFGHGIEDEIEYLKGRMLDTLSIPASRLPKPNRTDENETANPKPNRTDENETANPKPKQDKNGFYWYRCLYANRLYCIIDN